MQILNPHSIPLQSINLIEASAGTGKSWTVTFLYLRLLLESQDELTVDQILVVTFTNAATKELRDDIRNRLLEALDAFENPQRQDINNEYIELLRQFTDRKRAIRRIKRAKLSIDEASIFTIHGFCQRVLSDYAFEAGLPFDSELQQNDNELMQQLADDFWRKRFHKAPRALLFALRKKALTPDSLLGDIRSAVGKPYLKILAPEGQTPEADDWHQLEISFQKIILLWKNEGVQIKEKLLEHPGLNQRNYKPAQIEEMCAVMDNVSTNLADFMNNSALEKLSAAKIANSANKGYEPPGHEFFVVFQQFLDNWNELERGSDTFIAQIRIELLQYLQQELPRAKMRLGILSFDDLLLQLDKALSSKAELAKLLRDKYRAALIDEFQDTDPIQYQIFKQIFGDTASAAIVTETKNTEKNITETKNSHAVFLVGDPKQAIYSFRGGDIYTYLLAKKDTEDKNHYTLETNWRSHANLIAAFNHLYGQSQNPFRDESIEYVKVKPGGKIDQGFISTKKIAPLRFWQYQQQMDEKNKPVEKVETIRSNIARSVAGDIAELLNAGQQNTAKIGDQAIRGGDIAVLVRSHTQGAMMKQALGERGISSVQSGKESIFETHEAGEIQYLLAAIMEPQREDIVRRALVTDMMGLNAADLLAFESDSPAWEQQLLKLYEWHQLWNKQGFLPMMRNLMQSSETHKRLLEFEDGERRLTNVLHLSELIHRESRQRLLGMEEIIRWLKQQVDNPDGELEERELRLESDENLVKIVTIHKSKGLEYPIVYCPFVGMSGGSFKDTIFTFNDAANTYLEMGSSDYDAHKALKIEEQKAEDTRLLYVALTRAKYHCTVVAFPEPINRNPDKTALGWLLTDGKTIEKDKNVFHKCYADNLKKLDQYEHISVEAMPEFTSGLRYQKTASGQRLQAREFSTEIKAQAQITSFSGLTYGLHAEKPDYDNTILTTVAAELLPAETLDNEQFPRGATAGSALHEIYENLDFAQPVSIQQEIIDSALNKWGFDQKHRDSARQLIENSLHAEMFAGFSLNKLQNKDRLNEMEFYLPLNRLQTDDLKQILFKHLPNNDPDNSDDGQGWQQIREAVKTLSFEEVEGYLKGFIDLIFRHEGKYYVVDYKSNSLPDYSTQGLFDAMAASHYYLQYLLYSVALHRYLKKRIPDYNWESHIGGAYYLFIRGMSAAFGQSQNQGSGVFFDKPGFALIEALDGLFMESLL